jgi:diacylglycerol kinase family enzyme
MASVPTRSMRLVVNGKSAGDPALRTAVAAVRENGVPLEVRVTWEAGDAARRPADFDRRDLSYSASH